MDLDPCAGCGVQGFTWTEHQTREEAGGLVSAYSGTCQQCDRQRDFEFRLSDPDPARAGFGGPQPSQIIDPGQFLALARVAAGSVPADPVDGSPEDRETAAEAIAFALAALAEVVKFVPAGADAVPVETLTSELARSEFAENPASFSLAALQATAEGYRRVLRAYRGE